MLLDDAYAQVEMPAPENAPFLVIVENPLDMDGARRVLGTIQHLSPDQEAIIDFREAREIEGTALSYLAVSLTNSDRAFELRGLMEHQAQHLRYLGIATEHHAE